MTATQMKIYSGPEFELRLQNAVTMGLLEIAKNLDKDLWRLPPHQRKFIWPLTKKEAWVERLASSSPPVGQLLTYQLTRIEGGKVVADSPVYINDGSQRIRTTVEFMNYPDRFGHSKEVAQKILERCQIQVQHMHYDNHQEALIDFELLNSNTPCTPYEYCLGVLTYMDDYKDHWKGYIDHLHHTLEIEGARLLGKKNFNRKQDHNFKRNDYALLYRFLSKDKSANNYDVSKGEVQYHQVMKKQVIEWFLRLELEKYNNENGFKEAEKQLNRFVTIVKQQTALFEAIWNKEGVQGAGISASLYRWLLDCHIWVKNRKMYNAEVWEEFIRQIFKYTNGRSRVTNPKAASKAINTTLSGAGKLPQICKYIEFDWENFESAKRKNPVSDYLPKAGYDKSHIKPVSKEGEGPTILEPASRNRSRGAKPIEDEQGNNQ